MANFNTDPYECSEIQAQSSTNTQTTIIVDESDPYCCDQYIEYVVPNNS